MSVAVPEASPDYFGRAFFSQYNLILLGGSALFSLASASPLPVLAGAGVELCWLLIGPRLGSFRRHVDAASPSELEAPADAEVPSGVRSLPPEYAQRIVAFGQAISALRALAPRSAGAEARTLSLALAELEQLRPAYLHLCELHRRLSRAVGQGTEAHTQEIARLNQLHAAEKDLGMKLGLRQAINAAQRAIDQQARYAEVRRVAELKVSSFERSLAQLRAKLVAHAEPAELVREIQELLAQVAVVAALEADAGS